MLQFQYAKVSENNTSFNSYRGIKVLSSLFDKVLKQSSAQEKSSLSPIHLVTSVPGHLAVSFHDGRQFVVFDAVPHQLRLTNIEHMKLQRFVLKEINDYLKNILAMKTLSHVIHLSFLNPSQSTQTNANNQKQKSKSEKQKTPNPKTNSNAHRKLQLLAVHSDGGIIIWNWNQIRYLWQYKIRKILPSPLSDAQSRQTYMTNTNNKLYEKDRPGLLGFCAVISPSNHLLKIPYLNGSDKANIQSANEQKYIRAFENLLYPQTSVKTSAKQSNSLHFLMVDYMSGDENLSNDSAYDIHRYLLHRSFAGITEHKYVSTRFIVSKVRLDVDYANINTPMMGGAAQPNSNVDQSKFADFGILMDGLEEIDFWTQYYSDSNTESGLNERRRVICVIEKVWTSRYGFILEMSVRRMNSVRKMTAASMMSSCSHTSSQEAFEIDPSEICIEKRLLYYVSPFMNEMIRIPFPNTQITETQYNGTKQKRRAKAEQMRKNKNKNRSKRLNESYLSESANANANMTESDTFMDSAKQEITRFMIGQHGTTKQLLLWDRFDNSFYILDENQLPTSSLSEYLHSYHKNKAEQFEKHSSKLSQKSQKNLKPKFDLPFGHFSDKQRRVEWKYICRFDLPNESWFEPKTKAITDLNISKRYQTVNEQFKIWGYHDWICVNVTHETYYIHLTNIVLHRRYLFHQYRHYKKQSIEEEQSAESESGGIKLQFPSPVYLSPLYREVNPSIPQRHQSFHSSNTDQTQRRKRLFSTDVSDEKHATKDVSEEWAEDDHRILACAVSVLPPDVENSGNGTYEIVADFGICTRDSIFRLNIHGLHEQVEAVNSCYEQCQSVLGGLNLLSRWGQTALIGRSKYLTDFLYQQSLFCDAIKSAQIKEALKIAPFPLLCATLYKCPEFDTLLLRHYQRTRDDFPKFTFNYGRIFGKKVMQNLLFYMDYIYKNQAPLPILNSDRKKAQTIQSQSNKPNKHRLASFIAQDLAILSGEVSMEYSPEIIIPQSFDNSDNSDYNNETLESDLLVDMDEIRTLVSSDSWTDLQKLEKILKLSGIRNESFDPTTFVTNPQFLCRILLLPASFRSNHEIEITTPLNLLASLCRFYDLIAPVSVFRLVQLLCHYQGTSSKKIASSALQGLNGIQSTDDLFEERIVSRVILCKIAHRYYEMLDFLLTKPLTLHRLNNAISTAKRFNQRLSDIQSVAVFKRLLSAWIKLKMNEESIIINKSESENEAESLNISSDWILELRPKGYNGFHFMKHITQEISQRKARQKRMQQSESESESEDEKKSTAAEIPILAGKNDIPVSVFRPVLMFFASELHPHR